jgi:hypothetical protein
MLIARSLLGCGLLSVVLPAQDHAPFQELAAAATQSLGIKSSPAAVSFDSEVTAAHALALHLGAVELLYPKLLLTSAQELTDLQQCAVAVCDAQRLLHGWITGVPAAPDLDAACRAVQTWLKSWRWPTTPGALTTVPNEASAAQRQFTKIIAEALAREPMTCRAQLWLAPTRTHFRHMCALLGAIAPQNRELLWLPHIMDSGEAWACRPRTLQIVAMEYAVPQAMREDHGQDGVRMDARDKGGLLQHVVQRALSSLVVMAFGDGVDRDLEAGLCQDVVIALLKENNARTGGSGRGAYAPPRSKFVPGGLSSGGKLPPINLDSQWRATKGADYFVKPLRLGQKNGAKHVDGKEADRLAHFLLHDDAGTGKHAVRAPFLARIGELPSVPATFVADGKELLRAYRSGFVHWLREFAGTNANDSRQKFASMLRALAAGSGKVSFAEASAQAYGMPLSASGPTPPSLEWKFLVWLSR